MEEREEVSSLQEKNDKTNISEPKENDGEKNPKEEVGLEKEGENPGRGDATHIKIRKKESKITRKERRERKKKKSRLNDNDLENLKADSKKDDSTDDSTSNNNDNDNDNNNDNNNNNNTTIESNNNKSSIGTPPQSPFKKKSAFTDNKKKRPFAGNPNTGVILGDRTKYTSSQNEEQSQTSTTIPDELDEFKRDFKVAIEAMDIEQLSNIITRLQATISENKLNFRFEDGQTLLHKAIEKKSIEMMKLLIEKGVLVNIPSLSGQSPLHFACSIGDHSTIEYLLSEHANPMQRDIDNKACLHYAVLSGDVECVELIGKQSGVLINHRDNHGCSALHYAVKLESPKIVEYLLSKGADASLADQNANRPVDHLPGYSRYLSTKNIKLSPKGKKVFKLLKKRGGTKVLLSPSTAKSEMIFGGGMRSRSLDHRNPAIANELSRLPFGKASVPSVNPLTPSSGGGRGGGGIGVGGGNNATSSLVNTNFHKEKDLELLYYAPSKSPSVATTEQQSSPSIPIRKTDKYGFYTKEEGNANNNSNNDNSSSNNNAGNASPHPSPLKSSKLLKEEKMEKKWLDINKSVTDLRSIKPTSETYKKIQKYCDRGIPDSVRGLVWKFLAGVNVEAESSSTYPDLLQQSSIPKVKEQILKDITRTMPNHILFQEKGHGQQMLTNVLTAFSVYKPSVGYCQGMGFITAMFLMYMPEEDAFWMLDRMVEEYRFSGLWDEHMTLVTECMHALSVLMQNYLPDVYAKLEEDNIPPISYVPQFFVTGYLYCLPFHMVVRVWDVFLLKKFDYLYAIAIGLFKVVREKIIKMKMDQVMIFLRFKDSGEELGFTIERLLKAAAGIFSKLSPNQIRKLEEEGRRIRDAERAKIMQEHSST